MIVPIFRNENNMMKFPQCVSYDLKKQVWNGWQYMLQSHDHPLSKVHELATAVYQIRGHIKGRTLLPFPQVAQIACSHSQYNAIDRAREKLLMRKSEYVRVMARRYDLKRYKPISRWLMAFS